MWPWDWIAAAGSGISGLTQKAVDWVNSLIASVMSWVTDAVNAIWRGINNVWHYTSVVWDAAVRFVNETASTIWQWIIHYSTWLGHWILGMVNDLWGYAVSVYKWALNQFDQVWNYIYGAVRDIYAWVNREVYQPLYRLYNGVVSWVSQLFNQVWQYIQHPELLVSLIGGYLVRTGWKYVRQFGAPVTRWIVRNMMGMAGEVFDVIEGIISSIL